MQANLFQSYIRDFFPFSLAIMQMGQRFTPRSSFLSYQGLNKASFACVRMTFSLVQYTGQIDFAV